MIGEKYPVVEIFVGEKSGRGIALLGKCSLGECSWEVSGEGLSLAKCQMRNCPATSVKDIFTYLFYFPHGDLRKELFIGLL